MRPWRQIGAGQHGIAELVVAPALGDQQRHHRLGYGVVAAIEQPLGEIGDMIAGVATEH